MGSWRLTGRVHRRVLAPSSSSRRHQRALFWATDHSSTFSKRYSVNQQPENGRNFRGFMCASDCLYKSESTTTSKWREAHIQTKYNLWWIFSHRGAESRRKGKTSGTKKANQISHR